MKIQTVNTSGYGALICSYFEKNFPNVAKPSTESLLEIISALIIGTKDTRYGPAPKPEYQVAIRKVISEAISRKEPIPMLIPWGGRKAYGYDSIDIAEVAALYQIINLDHAIRMYYEPGIRANIRIEDVGALWLYQKDDVNSVSRYSDDFKKLVHILKGDTKLVPIKEGQLVDMSAYFENAQINSDKIYEYLMISDLTRTLGSGPAFEVLRATGWHGTIPFEQREHYISMYRRIEPSITDDEANRKLSDYLGAAKARIDLKGTAKPETDYGFIQVSFTPPVPGSPASVSGNNVYYRTVPLKDGRTHISPWRAKGYLAITGNEVHSKITSYGNQELIETLECDAVTLSHEKLSVDVRVDFVLQDTMIDETVSGIVKF